MKTKLFGRMTLLAFVLMVTLSFGLLSPMLLTLASGATTITGGENTNGYYIIELTNYQSSYDYDDLQTYETTSNGTVSGFLLPDAKVKVASTSSGLSISDAGEGTYNLKTTVRNSSGRAVDVYDTTVDNEARKVISVSQSDTYYITYSVSAKEDTNAPIATATRDIEIAITTKDASLEFDSNSAQIIPTVVQAGDQIVFPWPTIKIGDNEEDDIAGSADNVTITLEGTLTEGNKSSMQPRTLEDVEIGGVTYKAYTITENDSGTFTVRYSYNNNGNTIYERFTFNVVSARPEVNLAINSWSSSIENLSLSVGQEADLPVPTVVNTLANNATVEGVYIEVVITDNQGSDPVTVTDFKFTPQVAGNYTLTYNIRDLFDHTTSFTIHKNYVRLSGDSITVKVVEPYEVDNVANMDIDKLANADYDIPTKVYKTATEDAVIDFPAIYAEGGWGDYSNLKLTRTIYRNNSLVAELESRPNGETGRNYLPNEVASYTFENDGTYTIRYEACYVDEDGNEISGTTRQLPSYTFVIEEVTSIPTTEVNVTAPTVAKSARKGGTITFNAPVVTDYIADTTTTVDTNLKIEVTYQYTVSGSGVGTAQTVTMEDSVYSITLDRPSDNSIDESTWGTVDGVKITFTATDDQKVSGIAEATVSIVDYSGDTTAPTLTGISFDGEANEGEIGLPTVTFTDQGDNATSIRLVAYVIKNDRVVDVINASTGLSATISAESYAPTEEGDYTITFIATDQNNNTSTFSISYTVDFNSGYSVTITGISAQEYGTVINLLDYIQVTDAGKNVEMQNLNIEITKDEVTQETLTALTDNTLLIQVQGAWTYPASDRLEGEIVTLEGDITVQAWAKDDAGSTGGTDGICDITQNASSKITFASSDSTNPVFTIAEEDLDGRNFEWDATTTANNTHELPWFATSSDAGSGINFDSMKIELTYQDDSEAFATLTIDDLNAEGYVEFTATKQGKINAVYSVADNMGNTYSRTFVLNIGDVTPPEIVLADDAVTSDTKVNGTLTIDLSKISIANDDLSVDDLEISITRDGTEISYERSENNENIIEISLDTAGTYVVTFDITDTANNNAQQVVKTFTVTADAGNTTNTSTIWGTVLIVVALIVLGVVIFFFVKPSKTKAPANVKAKKEKDEVKKDENTK